MNERLVEEVKSAEFAGRFEAAMDILYRHRQAPPESDRLRTSNSAVACVAATALDLYLRNRGIDAHLVYGQSPLLPDLQPPHAYVVTKELALDPTYSGLLVLASEGASSSSNEPFLYPETKIAIVPSDNPSRAIAELLATDRRDAEAMTPSALEVQRQYELLAAIWNPACRVAPPRHEAMRAHLRFGALVADRLVNS